MRGSGKKAGPRALFLATYPRAARQSGGVVRLDALAQALESASIETHTLAIVPPRSWRGEPHRSETIIEISSDVFTDEDRGSSGFEEVVVGLRSGQDTRLAASAMEVVERFGPDIFVLEQPFLLPLLNRLRDKGRGKLVYSAANVEAPLKLELAEIAGQHFKHRNREGLFAEVDRLEREAAAAADVVVCISPAVRDAVAGWGARETVVCGNGSRVADTDHRCSADSPIARHLRSAPGLLFGYLGTGYWPNVDGLARVVSPSLAFLPITSRLLLAGTVGSSLRQHPLYGRGRLVNDKRTVDFGYLAPADYDTLARECDVLLAPLFAGSGSPLKSADILATGRPAILTRRATQGYEDVLAAVPDGIRIVDTPAEFRRAWHETAGLSREELDAAHRDGSKRRPLLTWSKRAEPFVDTVRRLVGP